MGEYAERLKEELQKERKTITLRRETALNIYTGIGMDQATADEVLASFDADPTGEGPFISITLPKLLADEWKELLEKRRKDISHELGQTLDGIIVLALGIQPPHYRFVVTR